MSNYQFNPNQEQWKEIPDFPGYEVSDHGRVMSFKDRNKTGRFLRQTISSTGYFKVRLYKKTIFVHRLMLIAFKGNPSPDKNQTRHLDGNRLNNRLDNLEWGTNKENVRDSINHGTFYHHPVSHAKLQPGEVVEIRQLLSHGKLTPRQIAPFYGVSKRTINRIRSHTVYKDI